jgi:hypothetical protein
MSAALRELLLGHTQSREVILEEVVDILIPAVVII